MPKNRVFFPAQHLFIKRIGSELRQVAVGLAATGESVASLDDDRSTVK